MFHTVQMLPGREFLLMGGVRLTKGAGWSHESQASIVKLEGDVAIDASSAGEMNVIQKNIFISKYRALDLSRRYNARCKNRSIRATRAGSSISCVGDSARRDSEGRSTSRGEPGSVRDTPRRWWEQRCASAGSNREDATGSGVKPRPWFAWRWKASSSSSSSSSCRVRATSSTGPCD